MGKESDEKLDWREYITDYYPGCKAECRRIISKIHDYSPDYIFFNECGSTIMGYVIKEAWKKAYPHESLPKFYRIDPRQVQKILHQCQLVKQGKAEITKELEEKKTELEDFFTKRLKKKEGKIMIYDQDWSSGYSPGSTLTVLKNPARFGFDEKIRRPNVKSILDQHGGKDIRPSEWRGLDLDFDSSDIIPVDPLSLRIWPKITNKTNGGYNFRARFDDKKYAQPNLNVVRAYKNFGREIGEQLHEELEQERQKKKSLEDKLFVIIAVAGIAAGLFFISSNFSSGNVQLSPGENNFFNWKFFSGIGLLIVGLVGAGFYFRRKI